MEICLLGPLEVHSQGRAVDVAGRRLRLLLAILALQPGQVVAAERLIDLLWEEASQPADPANALQALVSRLRRVLEAASSGDRLSSRPSGYLLAVAPDQVDALRFERLCRDGHEALAAGRHLQAAATLREALDLWRGPPLMDFAAEAFAAANATRLEELRLGALEDRIEAELGLGEHARLVGELEVLAAEHPLRERLQALLMRALYGAGRQADALAAYQRVRRALAEGAGLDPGVELRRVEKAILAQDPSLSTPPVAAGLVAPEPASQTRPRRGNLRGPLTSFVGREEELARIRELLIRHRLVTLTGPGGVGKTRLAVEAARRLDRGIDGDQAEGDEPDTVWLVELAGLAVGRVVALAVLGTLGLGERPRLDGDGPPHLAVGIADAADRLVAALERTGRCSSLTTANISPGTWRRSPSDWWRPVPGCACWRPAASRCGCPGRCAGPCRRCRSRRPARCAPRNSAASPPPGCSWSGPPRPSLGSRSVTRPTPPRWRRCAVGSTGCRSRSSWPPRGSAHCRRASWPRGWTTASGSSPRARAPRCRASRPCGRWWTGAGSYSRGPSGPPCGAFRCSWAAALSTLPSGSAPGLTCPARRSRRRSPGWSTSRWSPWALRRRCRRCGGRGSRRSGCPRRPSLRPPAERCATACWTR